jgi:hypothetical protein
MKNKLGIEINEECNMRLQTKKEIIKELEKEIKTTNAKIDACKDDLILKHKYIKQRDELIAQIHRYTELEYGI